LNCPSDITGKRGDDTDKIFGVGLNEFIIETRFVVEAFQIGKCDELDEVLVASEKF
jgi:hypothetical protein